MVGDSYGEYLGEDHPTIVGEDMVGYSYGIVGDSRFSTILLIFFSVASWD